MKHIQRKRPQRAGSTKLTEKKETKQEVVIAPKLDPKKEDKKGLWSIFFLEYFKGQQSLFSL
jgi:hypothetical protein